MSSIASGPIAPYDRVQRVIDYPVTQIPGGKPILGVGPFGSTGWATRARA
jgi:spore germination protein YaaH